MVIENASEESLNCKSKVFRILYFCKVDYGEIVKYFRYSFEHYFQLVPMQPGDVSVTYADTSALERDFGFKPSTSLREGLRKFAEWYKEFYM